MNNQKSIAWGKGSLALSLLLSMAYVSPAFAFSGGVTGQACTNCHNTDTASITLSGPAEVLPDSINTYTLTILDGPLEEGGLNVWVDDGILGLITGDTRIENGEITHSTPQVGDGSSAISWDFSWMAPTVNGIYNLMGQAVSSNDAAGSGGDWAGMTSIAVQVIPIPGAVFLFGSALGLLGWIRRRVS